MFETTESSLPVVPGWKENMVEVQQVLVNLIIATYNLLNSKHQNQTFVYLYLTMI